MYTFYRYTILIVSTFVLSMMNKTTHVIRTIDVTVNENMLKRIAFTNRFIYAEKSIFWLSLRRLIIKNPICIAVHRARSIIRPAIDSAWRSSVELIAVKRACPNQGSETLFSIQNQTLDLKVVIVDLNNCILYSARNKGHWFRSFGEKWPVINSS